MEIALLAGAVVAVVSVVLAAALPVGDDKRTSLARAFAYKVDLAPRADLVQALGRRLERRARIGWGTYGVGLGFYIASLAWLPGSEVASAIRLLAFWAVVQLGRGLGALTVQTVDDHGGQRPRAAHLASPSLFDFVTPVEVWWTRTSALAAVAVVAYTAVGGNAAQRGAALALLAACVTGWALIELAVLFVVRSRPEASDVQSLAFDDALRAESLRALLFAAASPLIAVSMAGDGIGLPSRASNLLVAAFAAGLVPLAWAGSQRAKQRFRRRLWGTPVTDPSTLSR